MAEVEMTREAYARALDRAHRDGRQSVLQGGVVVPRELLEWLIHYADPE